MQYQIYADNAATTKISDAVFDAMLPYLKDQYGNPSSIYKLGRDAGFALEEARAKVAKGLNCSPKEIFFTGCGSESDNWALKGTILALKEKGKNHIITTNFEHHAILHTCQALEKQGCEVTYLPVDSQGLITAEQVAAAITDKTAIVSVMYANNEIGTIQPIKEIGAVCREKGVWFHTDAVQAVGNVEIDVQDQNIDMLSLSGHKIHAPKGVGAMYIRRGIRIPNFMDGGGQESGRRAGTENLASIIALGKAMEIACDPENIARKAASCTRHRDMLIENLTKVSHSHLNGHPTKRLPGTVNISFEGVEGESLLLMLDMKGIQASSGSACTSGSLDPSHVLLALGLTHEVAHGSLRLSINEDLTDDECQYICDTVPEVIDKLRAMSPLWEKIASEK